MTFWYVFGMDLLFFELFKLYSSLGIDHDPPCSYVYPFSHVSFFTRSHGQEKSLSYYDLLYDFRSTTDLWTHPHPHFLPPPPQPHHPYTPRLRRSTMAPLGEGSHQDERCGHPADLGCTSEDSPRSRLGTARVEQVLPST